MSIGAFNFNFLAIIVSEKIGVPNLHQGTLDALAKKIIPIIPYLKVLLISSGYNSFRENRGYQIYTRGLAHPSRKI